MASDSNLYLGPGGLGLITSSIGARLSVPYLNLIHLKRTPTEILWSHDHNCIPTKTPPTPEPNAQKRNRITTWPTPWPASLATQGNSIFATVWAILFPLGPLDRRVRAGQSRSGRTVCQVPGVGQTPENTVWVM
jgi:hypothetical protein